MRIRNYIVLASLLLNFYCFSQKWPSKEYINKFNYKEVIGDTIGTNQKTISLKFAMYPDGKEGINNLIRNEIRYPNTNEKPKNDGRVLLKYVVDKKGEIVEIEILESAGNPFDMEAIRVLKKMDRWIPGKLEDEFVRVSYRQPFRFK